MFDISWDYERHGRMNFRELNFCVFDFETTGVDTEEDRICQATFVQTVMGDKGDTIIVKEVDRLVNPGIPIPEGASNVHGVTDDMVVNRPRWGTQIKGQHSFGELFYAYMNRADVICGWNIHNFDIPILFNELKRAGVEGDLTLKPYVDLIYWYREYRGKMSEAKLSNAAARLGCGGQVAWGVGEARYHDALTDVRVCADLLWKMSVEIISLTTIREIWEEQEKLIETQNAYLEKRYGKR